MIEQKKKVEMVMPIDILYLSFAPLTGFTLGTFMRAFASGFYCFFRAREFFFFPGTRLFFGEAIEAKGTLNVIMQGSPIQEIVKTDLSVLCRVHDTRRKTTLCRASLKRTGLHW